MSEPDQLIGERATAVYTQLIAAWNRRSATDFAALFSDSGNAVGFDGSPLDGRAAIASAIDEIFTSHPTAAYVAKVREVRRLTPETTLLRAVVGMIPPGQTELNPAVNAIQSLVLVEEDGHIKIALLHNTPATFHGRPQLARQLTAELTDVMRSGQAVHTQVGPPTS